LSSRFTTSLGADYAQPLTDGLAGVLGLGFYHRSAEFSGIGSPFTIPSWNTLDMHLGVKAKHWDLSVFCKNCTNEIRPLQIAADAGDANPLAGPPVLTLSQHWSYNSVRTIGLRGGMNF
jgi:iron complex outermembrane recepter protein